MPVVNFHLLAGQSSPEQDALLLKGACHLYSEVLQTPLERTRAFITLHEARHFAVAGELCSDTRLAAPFFEFMVLDGRPKEERRRLLLGFTELLVRTLDVRSELIRGMCLCVAPGNWGIGGVPASMRRAEEIQARAGKGGHEA